MEKENTIKKLYSRKIRIYPNKEQLILFDKCFNVSRYMYNRGVEYTKNQYEARKNYFNEICDNKTTITSL